MTSYSPGRKIETTSVLHSTEQKAVRIFRHLHLIRTRWKWVAKPCPLDLTRNRERWVQVSKLQNPETSWLLESDFPTWGSGVHVDPKHSRIRRERIGTYRQNHLSGGIGIHRECALLIVHGPANLRDSVGVNTHLWSIHRNTPINSIGEDRLAITRAEICPVTAAE